MHLKPELGSDLERQVLAVKERRGLYPEAVVVLISVDILADRSGRLDRLPTQASDWFQINYQPFAPADFSQPLRLLMAGCRIPRPSSH